MPRSLDRSDRRRLGWGAVWVAVLAYGWWFTDREPFSDGAFRGLLVAIGVLLAAALVRRLRSAHSARSATRTTDAPRSRAPGFRAAAAVWAAALVALVAWELIALRSSPRSEHPTISSFVETLEHHHIARLALFAGWVCLGWTLAT